MALTAANILDCKYSVMDDWKTFMVYTCEARFITISGSREVTAVSGTHAEDQNENDVEGLRLTNQNIGFFPRSIGDFFPNLVAIRMDYIGVVAFTPEDFIGLSNLRQLAMEFNNLQVIDYNSFGGSPLIRSIDFNHNPIRHVAHNAFVRLTELSTLLVFSAVCISDGYVNDRSAVETFLLQLTIKCPPFVTNDNKGFSIN